MRHVVLSTIFCFPAALVLLAASPAEAVPPIELEVLVEARAPITAQQEWLKRLSELKLAGLSLRTARDGEQPEIVNRGTDDRPRYKVVALLTTKEQLVLKGGQFGRNDMARLRAYLETLGVQGEEGVTKRRSMFGLTDEQLIALVKNMEPVVDFETKDQPPAEVIERIGEGLVPTISLSFEAERALKDAPACRDELKGVSAGTALAVLVRPYGLIVQPATLGRDVQLRVVAPTANTEYWPIGWPLEGTEKAALPALLEFINVEIKDIALPDALAAVQERLEAPFLFDHNQLAKHGIDPAKIEVSIPAGRSYYKKILERLLFQARLKYEIRTDELGKPIVWITTIKA